MQCFGSDFEEFRSKMESLGLIVPETGDEQSMMMRKVDLFMDEMFYKKKRRRN
jgi:hypothetical protein